MAMCVTQLIRPAGHEEDLGGTTQFHLVIGKHGLNNTVPVVMCGSSIDSGVAVVASRLILKIHPYHLIPYSFNITANKNKQLTINKVIREPRRLQIGQVYLTSWSSSFCLLYTSDAADE